MIVLYPYGHVSACLNPASGGLYNSCISLFVYIAFSYVGQRPTLAGIKKRLSSFFMCKKFISLGYPILLNPPEINFTSSTQALFFTFINFQIMPTITIVNSNPTSGELRLRPRGTVLVPRKETLTWKLGVGCGVKLISNILPKDSPPSTVIWLKLPHRDVTSDNWQAVIDGSSADYSEYNYMISWIPKEGTDPDPAHPIKHYDPKIAVKPEKFNFTVLAITVASVFTAIFSMMLFRKRRKSK